MEFYFIIWYVLLYQLCVFSIDNSEIIETSWFVMSELKKGEKGQGK